MPPLTIRLNPADNVVVARADLLPGSEIAGENLQAHTYVPAGHKIATAAIGAGEAVRKYGQILGFAIEGIAPGDHVHTHNMAMGDFARDYAFGVDAHAVEPASGATFQGIVRADGRVEDVGTRGALWWGRRVAQVLPSGGGGGAAHQRRRRGQLLQQFAQGPAADEQAHDEAGPHHTAPGRQVTPAVYPFVTWTYGRVDTFCPW